MTLARAGWDPPERCPDCGKILEVEIGVDVDLCDGYRAPTTVELLCLGCDWRLVVSL